MLELSQKLFNKKLTIATAESCTGGLLASTLSNVRGSSNYLMGGIVAYNSSIKNTFLNIPINTIIYSKKCANLMNIGLQKQINADIYVSVTGYLEPLNIELTGIVFYSILYKNKNLSFRMRCHPNLTRKKQKEFIITEIIYTLNRVLK